MSEWNLSVRLTGQGSGLARTLRDVSSDARSASNEVNALRRNLALLRTEASNDIRVRLDLDADHLRSDVNAALTGAATGQGIQVRLDIDSAHLRNDVNAALTTAGAGQGIRIRLDLDADHLRDEVNAAVTTAGAGQGLGVRLALTDTMQLRRDVQDAVRWAAWGHRIEIPIGLTDPMQLRRDVSAAVRWASMNQTVTVRVTADTSSLTTLAHTLSPGGGGGGADGGLQGGLAGLLTLAPAAIPLATGLAANMAPLAAEFGAAGIGAAAFGIALAGQIGPLGEAADAEKKYREAVVQHGERSKQAMEAGQAYRQQLDQLPPATQRAAIAVSTLKNNFGDWSNSMSRFTMEPVTKGITVLDAMIPRLTPEVKSASTQLDRLVTVAGGAISTPGFDALSTKIASFTDGKLDQLTDQVIHIMRVLSEGNADSGALGAILDYARQNGPAAREAISAISQAVITLVQGAAQAGPGMLALVTAAARLVAALPPELVGIILSVASALKLLQLSGAGMAALAGGITRVRTAIASLTAVSAAAGGGLAGLRAAFLSLGLAARASIIVAGIAAVVLVLKGLSDMGKKAPPNVDKLTTSLGNLGKTGKASGEAARAFGKDFSGLSDSLRTLSRPSNMDKTQQFLTKLVGMDSTPVADAKKDLDAVDKSLANLVQGGKADIAQAAVEKLSAAMRKQGMSGKELRAHLDDYNSALADQKFEQELAAESMGIFGKASQDTSAKLDAQKRSADGLRQSIIALNETNRSAYDAQIGFEQAVDDLSAAFKKNGATLDLNTQAGRDNGQAMSAAAKSQDDMIASGLAAGESLDSMTTKSNKLRTEMLRLATEAFDGNKKKATEYVNTLLGTPEEIKTIVKLERQEAITGLQNVQAEITKTPGAKRVVVETLNAAAIAALEAVGLKTERLPDGKTAVFTANGESLGSIGAVRRALDALDGKTANTYVTNHVLTIRETRAVYNTVGRPTKGEGGVSKYADGGIARAADGLFVPGYAPRRDIVPAILSPGEGVLVPETVRKLGASTGLGGQGIIKALNAWGRYGSAMRFADGGIAGGVQHFASGGFTYNPTGTMKSISDVSSAYSSAHQPITKDEYNKKIRARANSVDSLRAAEARLAQVRKGKHTHAQLVAAENTVAKARRGLATATDAAKSAEARYKKQFSLSDWNKTLSSTVKANAAYEANLKKIASRGGADVVDQLRDMGAEGATMVSALAKASKSQFNGIVANLRKLAPIAKATLSDYTAQLNASNKTSAAFQANLVKLAGMGYGDLATQLAAQGDEAAQKLAADAVKSKSSAAKANTAAKNSANTLSSDQLTELVQIIAAISSSKTGIHDVAGKTGIGEDEIITVANKAKTQIQKSLGSRSTKFLADLGNANKHLAYANGGIRAGIYATRGGAVTFAEPETGGEAFLPLGASKRRHALPVLSDVAHRFGLGLTDVAATRPVVIVREAGATHVNVTAVRTGATATDIGTQVGRSVRRARRGGVAARA